MNFRIISSTELEDKSLRLKISICSEELVYLGYILESFEGFCNYTTVFEDGPLLQVDVVPDFIAEVNDLIRALENWEL